MKTLTMGTEGMRWVDYPVILWAADVVDVSRRLLGRDGIWHVEPVGTLRGNRFSLAFCHRDCMDNKDPRAIVIDKPGLFTNILGGGGGGLYFLIGDRAVPPGEVWETQHLQEDMVSAAGVPLAALPGTPLVVHRTFTFKELGL
jgi:hypothetical protein